MALVSTSLSSSDLSDRVLVNFTSDRLISCPCYEEVLNDMLRLRCLH